MFSAMLPHFILISSSGHNSFMLPPPPPPPPPPPERDGVKPAGLDYGLEYGLNFRLILDQEQCREPTAAIGRPPRQLCITIDTVWKCCIQIAKQKVLEQAPKRGPGIFAPASWQCNTPVILICHWGWGEGGSSE